MAGDGFGLDQQGASRAHGVKIALLDEDSNPPRRHPQLRGGFSRRQKIQTHFHYYTDKSMEMEDPIEPLRGQETEQIPQAHVI